MFPKTHAKITGAACKAAGMANKDVKIVSKSSMSPDLLEFGLKKLIRHGYMPQFTIGLAPERFYYNLQIGTLKSLGKALHYLQDLGNPFHTTVTNQKWHYPMEALIELEIDEYIKNIKPESCNVTPYEFAKASHSILTETVSFWRRSDYKNLIKLGFGLTKNCVNASLGVLKSRKW